MRFCRTLLFIAMAMQFPTFFVLAAMPQEDGTKPPASVRAALGAIFAEEHVVLGAMKMGTDPVPLGLLRALIHTGGEKRKSVIRFKAFRIRADQIVDG